MKYISQISTLIIVCFLSFNIASAQETIPKEYKEKTINSLSQLMNDFYVFPEVAKLTEVHLKTLLKEGYFDQFRNNLDSNNALSQNFKYYFEIALNQEEIGVLAGILDNIDDVSNSPK